MTPNNIDDNEELNDESLNDGDLSTDENDDVSSELSDESTGVGVNPDGINVTPLTGMYKSWFLDYASYVILERAVPHINDGLKPVQRRILHAMKRLDDGRYNKVANIIGYPAYQWQTLFGQPAPKHRQ